MTFDEILTQVLDLLQPEKRVSYRALKRRFDLGDDYLEDVKDEFIYAKKLAVYEDNHILVWTGETGGTLGSIPLSTPPEQQFRPIVVTPKGESGREYWYIDGKIRGLARQAVTAPDVRSLEEKLGRKMAAPQEAREGENVEVRLQHMDELGVDIQVLWPTLFLERSRRPPGSGGRGLQELQSLDGPHLAAGPGAPALGLRAAVAEHVRGAGRSCASRTITARWASSCAASRTSICSTIPTSSPSTTQ